MLLSEIMAENSISFEVKKINDETGNFWAITAWVEPPMAFELADLYNSEEHPEEVASHFKKIVSVQRTEEDKDENPDAGDTITKEDDGIIFVYDADEYDADDALQYGKELIASVTADEREDV